MTGTDPADEAAKINLIRRRVLNVVGHELRTPFTTLRGLADQLAAAPQKAEELAPAIARIAGRIDDLLDDLLVASGVSTAESLEEPRSVDLAAIVSEVWAAAGGELDAVTGAPAPVHGRPGNIRSTIARVVENAWTHGEEPRNIHLDGPSVAVTCQAPGLSDGDIDAAFETFYRGERAVMTNPGLGVGLPIARQLAEREQGTVHATLDGVTLTVVARFAP